MEEIRKQLDGLSTSMIKLVSSFDESVEKINDRLNSLEVKVDKKQQISEELKSLIEVNGKDAVITAFKQCVGSTKLKETAGYATLISPDIIKAKFNESLALKDKMRSISDTLANLEEKYAGVICNLNTFKLDVKMAEANAMVNAPADLKNAELRNAFRRQSSSFEREKLADAEDRAAAIRAEINSYSYKYYMVKEELAIVKKELETLGNIFKFLA